MEYITEVKTYMAAVRKNLLLIGKAGSGKSHLIAEFIRRFAMNSIVVAPTGIAALNLESKIEEISDPQTRKSVFTIHCAFGLAPCLAELEASTSLSDTQVNRILVADQLIIDEISMVRADILDRLDLTLQKIRKDDRAFGGMKVIMVGDPFQLPPITTKEDIEYLRDFYHPHTTLAFFFESRIFKRMLREGTLECLELTHTHRQKDPEFIEVLDACRIGEVTTNHTRFLNQAVRRASREPWKSLHLTVDNGTAGKINRFCIENACRGETMTVKPRVEFYDPYYTGLVHNHQMNQTLNLRKGMRIMFTQNDLGKRYMNGSRGTIQEMAPEKLLIILDHQGREVAVERSKFQIMIPKVSPINSRIYPSLVGAIEQFPITGGYAITIHRSQALTLDSAVIGFGRGTHTPGQGYTAISRVRDPGGLILTMPVHPVDFHASYQVKALMREIEPITLKVEGALAAELGESTIAIA